MHIDNYKKKEEEKKRTAAKVSLATIFRVPHNVLMGVGRAFPKQVTNIKLYRHGVKDRRRKKGGHKHVVKILPSSVSMGLLLLMVSRRYYSRCQCSCQCSRSLHNYYRLCCRHFLALF